MKIKQARLFKKQARALQKRGADMTALRTAVVAIMNNDRLKLAALKDHALKGQFKGDRELHVQGRGDWLLRYRITEDTVFLWLLATGSHRDTLNVE